MSDLSDRKSELLEKAAEIAMEGWHSVEEARSFACAVSDYLSTPPAVVPAVPSDADAAIAAGDATLHGAIDLWQARATRAEELADSEGTRAVNYLRRARKAESLYARVYECLVEVKDRMELSIRERMSAAEAYDSFYAEMVDGALSQTTQPQAEPGDGRPQNFWQGMDPWMVEFIGRGVGLVKVLYNEPHDAIDRSRTGDWIQTAIEVFKKAQAHGVASPPAATPAAPEPIAARGRDALSVACPHCWQKAGEPCIWPETRTHNRDAPHDAREAAARDALAQPAPVAAPASIEQDLIEAKALAKGEGSRALKYLGIIRKVRAVVDEWPEVDMPGSPLSRIRTIVAFAGTSAAPAPASEAVAVWQPSADELVANCIDNSLKRAAGLLRSTGHAGDSIDAGRLEYLRTTLAAPPQAGAGKDGAQ